MGSRVIYRVEKKKGGWCDKAFLSPILVSECPHKIELSVVCRLSVSSYSLNLIVSLYSLLMVCIRCLRGVLCATYVNAQIKRNLSHCFCVKGSLAVISNHDAQVNSCGIPRGCCKCHCFVRFGYFLTNLGLSPTPHGEIFALASGSISMILLNVSNNGKTTHDLKKANKLLKH